MITAVAGVCRQFALGLILTKWNRWLVTCAAMAVSTYALDFVASGAGLALVASSLLNGVSLHAAALFLAASYVVWAMGLHTNLGANWALLRHNGTSTNVLSKAAFDLAGKWYWSSRAQRVAADTGYVLTELAKEAPYYAAALSAAAFTDFVSAQEAMIFLAGANLGAAAYEYGLARLVRIYLKRRDSQLALLSNPIGKHGSIQDTAAVSPGASKASADYSTVTSAPMATRS